jgi:hypothetical protein
MEDKSGIECKKMQVTVCLEMDEAFCFWRPMRSEEKKCIDGCDVM